MSAIIQVSTLANKIIDKARWEVSDIVNLREGHQLQISLSTKDSKLLSYIGKNNQVGVSVDKSEGGYSVILLCTIKKICHMLEIGNKQVESLAIITPSSRMVEHIMTYLISPDKCDPRAIKLIQSN